MTKFAFRKKIHPKIILTKRKNMPSLVRSYIAHPSAFISPDKKLIKKKFTEYFAAFLWLFYTPFSNGKDEVTRQMKHAAMVVTDYSGEVYVATRTE